MCFGNARAIAGLWQRFVRYLREGCWDQGRLLPRMGFPTAQASSSAAAHSGSVARAREDEAASGLPRPDFSCCLLHQKLQMLNLCIQQAHHLPEQQLPEPGGAQQVRFLKYWVPQCSHNDNASDEFQTQSL